VGEVTEALFAEDPADRDPEFDWDDAAENEAELRRADPELTLTAPELREALRQTRETLREVLGEFTRMDLAPSLWHVPGIVRAERMAEWRQVAGLATETETK
jgi:hypothetical protein